MNAYCVLLGGSVGNQLPFYSYKSGWFYVKDTTLFMVLAIKKRFTIFTKLSPESNKSVSELFSASIHSSWRRTSKVEGGQKKDFECLFWHLTETFHRKMNWVVPCWDTFNKLRNSFFLIIFLLPFLHSLKLKKLYAEQKSCEFVSDALIYESKYSPRATTTNKQGTNEPARPICARESMFWA